MNRLSLLPILLLAATPGPLDAPPPAPAVPDRADRFDLVDAIESIVESQKALDEAAAKEHPEHGFTEQAYIAYSEAVAERDAAIYLAGRLAKSVRKSPILHSCTNAAPCPRCST